MQVGQRAELLRTFTGADLEAYSALGGGSSGDHVPEPLIAALFSRLLGVDLPGPGTNYLKQEIAFLAKVPCDVPLRASVEVTRVRFEKCIVDLWATVVLPDGSVAAEGRALVKVPDLGGASV